MGVIGLDGGRDLSEVNRAIGPVLERLGVDRPEDRHPATLPSVSVGMLSEDGLFAACALRHHRDQIGLGARGDEERGLETEHLRGLCL